VTAVNPFAVFALIAAAGADLAMDDAVRRAVALPTTFCRLERDGYCTCPACGESDGIMHLSGHTDHLIVEYAVGLGMPEAAAIVALHELLYADELSAEVRP
jgi:hypothetical protein